MALKSIAELTALAAAALKAHGASDRMAQTTAKYLVAADVQGLATHGTMRVASYCGHLGVKRADGSAVPKIVNEKSAACLIDAGNGTVKVAWSDAHNGSPRTGNSIVPIPSGLVTTGGSVIFAEVTYYYSSPTGKLIYGSIPLQDKFYMRPRRVAQVARTSTTCCAGVNPCRATVST